MASMVSLRRQSRKGPPLTLKCAACGVRPACRLTMLHVTWYRWNGTAVIYSSWIYGRTRVRPHRVELTLI